MKKIFLWAVCLYAGCLPAQTINEFTETEAPFVIGRTEMLPFLVDTLPPPVVTADSAAGPRNLYFIHGLGGSAAAWNRVPDACMNADLDLPDFPARECETFSVEYANHTLSSLSYASQSVLNQIRTHNVTGLNVHSDFNPSRSILIGHSQGGLVGRTLLHLAAQDPAPQYGPDFGGFINVAGPLGGAAILNNRQMIYNMANEACNLFSQGALEEKRLINLIFKHFLGNDYIQQGCDLFTNSVLPLFFQQYFDPITADYLVGAPYLQTLAADTNLAAYREMPKITFYCVEPRDRIFWRTLSWMVTNPNTADYFAANPDFSFSENYMQPLYYSTYASWVESRDRLEYLDEHRFWKDLLTLWIININRNKHEENLRNKQAILNWFENVHTQWEVVIGARTYREETETVYYCQNCIGLPWYFSYAVASTAFSDPSDCWEYGCITFYSQLVTNIVPVLEENDGVVTASSAKQLPYQTWYPVEVFPWKFDNVASKGSSHMQVRNDEGIKTHLRKAFEGDYGDFFRTDQK